MSRPGSMRGIPRRARSDENTAETLAFVRGKADFTRGPAWSCPFAAPDMRASWQRGQRFAAQQAAGLRPIDTVRVVAPPPSRLP